MKIEKLKDLLKDFGDKVKFDYDLKKMNWFNIGGKTKAFYKADNLKDLASQFKSVLVVEMNDGQLYNLLKVDSIPKAKSLTQVSGKPFRVYHLLEAFQKIIKSGK